MLDKVFVFCYRSLTICVRSKVRSHKLNSMLVLFELSVCTCMETMNGSPLAGVIYTIM